MRSPIVLLALGFGLAMAYNHYRPLPFSGR
jgi:hypothetical protein